MQGRPVGDWIVLILSLLVVVGLASAYFISLMRDRYNPVAMCQRSDITYGLLGALSFVGMVLAAFSSTGPDWLHSGLTVVGAPVLLSLIIFSLVAGKKSRETTLQVILLGSLVVLIYLAWLLTRGQPDRMSVVGYMTGATFGWLVLERKKRFLLPNKNGMIQVQVVELIEEDETG